MPTINGRFVSSYSPYQSLQIERARMSAARQQAESDSATLTSVLGDSASSLSQGLADLAAKQALARVNAAVSAKQALTTAADPSATDTSAADTVDPATAVDEAINGIDDLIAGTQAESDGTDAATAIDGIVSGSADLTGGTTSGDATTDINQIIDGTSDLLASAPSDSADGGDLFSAIDSIINSFTPPPSPSVDITA